MGTLTVIIKIVRILWTFMPFLTNVIFNDRQVSEVIKENISFTIIFFLFIITALLSATLASSLADVRAVLKSTAAENNSLKREFLLRTTRKEGDGTLLIENSECTYEEYDPYDSLRRLDLD